MKNSRNKNWNDIFKIDIKLIVGVVPNALSSDEKEAIPQIQMISLFD